ncbi:Germin-like protein 12-1 [Glycine soja]|uniref:Germin-like protein n=1 Tax=Glycine soja TaxID=3848 RepID=A0A445FCS8_GLYSO|nr:Germin-like protein 12-1 [Glycine soja]
MKVVYFLVAILALTSSLVSAYDPSPLQDFCVAAKEKDGALARIDFAPKGLNAPHTHPRGTEILIVLEGTLYVGFVTSNQDGNRLFTKVLNKGDVFVFPIGLIHFQMNMGNGNAVAIAGLSSQNPGAITIANALFKVNPPISSEVLTKAFQVDKTIIDYLQKQSWYDNNN